MYNPSSKYTKNAEDALRNAGKRYGEDRDAALREAEVWARLAQAAAAVYAADMADKR